MKRLRTMLLAPVADNERARRYLAVLDNQVERDLPRYDIDRGIIGARGVALPHETIDGFWNLSFAERARHLDDESKRVYLDASGRTGTSPLSIAAFCWWCPLSRHHGDERLLRFFANGLDFYTGTVHDDGAGLGVLYSEKPEHPEARVSWSHTWTIEGLIYGLVRCWVALDPALRERALARLRRAADTFHAVGPSGEYGNQAVIQCLGLFYLADLFDEPAFRGTAERYWADVRDKVLDPSGQVMEQGGPCLHYSITAFFYVWLTCHFLGETGASEPLRAALQWFRRRHTESLVPLAGASSRMYRESLNAHMVDLVPACEQAAAADPMYRRFADRLLEATGWEHHLHRHGLGHGNSPFMWAAQCCTDTAAPTAAQEAAWRAPFHREYRKAHVLARGSAGSHFGPIRYAIVHERYQTQYTFRDRLPFAGVQTWALDDEPPIIHPTPDCPSTTQAWGIDTARQGVSQMPPQPARGGGQNTPGHLMRSSLARPLATDELDFLIARYDRLWQAAVFTPLSTVLFELGDTGARKTFWTLNRLAPAEPRIEDGVVRFAGRRACLHSFGCSRPELREMSGGEWLDGVRVLEYDCSGGVTAFAFSNDSFHFEAAGETRTLYFADADGRYRLEIGPLLSAALAKGSRDTDMGDLVNETRAGRSA